MSGSVSIIQQYYTNILQRPADQAGLNFWVSQANAGTPLPQIETSFATSPEAMTFVNPMLQFYQGILDRNADPSGLNFWVNEFRSGTLSLSTIATDFVASGEGQAVLGHPGTTVTSTAVNTLYVDALGRTASGSEITYWQTSGLSLGGVAEDISLSPEATNFQAGLNLSFLLGAGNGIYPPPGQSGQSFVLTLNQTNYTGTPKNDTFTAPTIFNVAGVPINSLQSADTINGNGGTDSLIATLAPNSVFNPAPTIIAPTLQNGLAVVDVSNSPDVDATFDLNNSPSVTQANLAGSDDTTLIFANSSSVATTSLTNSNESTESFTAAGATPGALANITILNSAGGHVDADEAALAGPTLNITITNSPEAADGTPTTVDYGSLDPTAPSVNTLNVNLTSSSGATLGNPDEAVITDHDTGALKTLTVTSTPTGFETVDFTGGPVTGALAASTLDIKNNGTSTATTGALALIGAFNSATTIDSTAYTGSLMDGTPSSSLAKAQGTTVAASYAGILPGNAGLTVGPDKNLTSITVGNGNNVLDLTTENDPNSPFTVTLGNGNNAVYLDDGETTKGTFTAGTGFNVVGISDGDITTGGDKFTNFQGLEIAGGGGTYDLSAFKGTPISQIYITGSNGAATGFIGSPILNNTPDNVSIVDTTTSGTEQGWTSSVLSVLLGAVTGNNHTFNFTLNADGKSTDSPTSTPGVVLAGALSIGQVTGDAGSFVPGLSTSTWNIASNIFNPGGTAKAANYTNEIFFGVIAGLEGLKGSQLPALDATTINVTGNASLLIGEIGQSGHPASNLGLLDASKSSGNVTTTIWLTKGGTDNQTQSFTYNGSSGVDAITVHTHIKINPSGASFVPQFVNQYTGNGGNDTFTVIDHGGDQFNYNAASDATISSTNLKIEIGDLGSGLSVETITGFNAFLNSTNSPTGATTKAVTATDVGDTINFVPLGIHSNDVLIGGEAGSNTAIGPPGFTAPITSTTDLTNVPNLFVGNSNGSTEQFYDGTARAFSNATGTDVAGAFVFEDKNNTVWIFADANNDQTFTAASDVAIHLTGSFSAAQVRTIAADINLG